MYDNKQKEMYQDNRLEEESINPNNLERERKYLKDMGLDIDDDLLDKPVFTL